MRVLLAVMLLLFAHELAAQPRAPRTLERIDVSGASYVSGTDWARLNECTARFDPRTGVIELNGRGTRWAFTINSRKATVNGVTVMLSLPVLSRGRDFVISVVDLNTTIQPIVYPNRNPKRGRVVTVCLDPGHGGRDTGKIDRGNYEKRYTLLLAQEVASLLKTSGIKVVLTRNTDRKLELPDRPAFASRQGADLFISLHYNAAANRNVQGMEVFCITPPSMASSNEGGGRANRGAYQGNVQNSQNVLLAYHLAKSILSGTGLEDRGLKRSRFEVLREARIPAVLIEGGFMTNPNDARKIYDPAFRKKMAQSILEGIMAYKRTVER